MSETPTGGPRNDGSASRVDFVTLVLSMRESALHLMGLAAADEEGVALDLEGARVQIDMLAVVQQKSRGNLEPDEEKLLDSVLYELQIAWVEQRKLRGA